MNTIDENTFVKFKSRAKMFLPIFKMILYTYQG